MTILQSLIQYRVGGQTAATRSQAATECGRHWGASTVTASYRVISLADWSSGCISEASPLFRDSLKLAREVTTFASVPRAPWLVSAY